MTKKKLSMTPDAIRQRAAKHRAPAPILAAVDSTLGVEPTPLTHEEELKRAFARGLAQGWENAMRGCDQLGRHLTVSQLLTQVQELSRRVKIMLGVG